MKRSIRIAQPLPEPHKLITPFVLARWASHENPKAVPVFYGVEAGVYPAGHCLRFWISDGDLWAEMEVPEDLRSLWSDPPPPLLRGDVVAGIEEGRVGSEETILMISVMVTTMPKFLTHLLFSTAEHHRQQIKKQRN